MLPVWQFCEWGLLEPENNATQVGCALESGRHLIIGR